MSSPLRVNARSAAGILAAVAALASAVAGAQQCPPQPCGPMLGGYGNVGFASGYSSWISRGSCGPPAAVCQTGWSGWSGGGRWGWSGGWNRCWNPGWNACWNPCAATWCPPVMSVGWCGTAVPYGGWSVGWPGWAGCAWAGPAWGWGGGFGTTWFGAAPSVFFSLPQGGFFSGSVMPIPYAIPVSPFVGVPFVAGNPRTAFARQVLAMPQAGVPLAGDAGVGPTPAILTTISAARSRPASNTATRRRAATLLAAGDRHLGEAAGDPQRLRAALGAYRRAASAAADEPDVFIREALVLVALGQDAAADRAIGRAIALDGRLNVSSASAEHGPATDPVFGDRQFGAPGPLAARGQAILRRVAAAATPPDGVGDEAAGRHLDRLAAAWAGRWQDGGRAVASTK